MINSQSHYPLIIILLIFSFSSCKEGLNTESPKAETWSKSDFLEYFNEDYNIINFALHHNLFNPEAKACTHPLSIENEKTVELENIDLINKNDINKFTKINNLVSFLYKTIPIVYIDKNIEYSFDYSIDKYNLDDKLETAKKAQLAGLCGNYSQFFKVMFLAASLNLENNEAIEAKTLSFNRPEDMIDHTLNLVIWEEDSQVFYLFVDAMYGYTFPVKNEKPLSINTLINETEKDLFNFLEKKDLKQKRFLTNKIWPCNFSPTEEMIYYKTPTNSITKYEVRGIEKIEYLFKSNETMNDYSDFLKNYLLKIAQSEV